MNLWQHVLAVDLNGFIRVLVSERSVQHCPVLGRIDLVTAEILLSGDSATLYTNPDLILGPIAVAAGYINPTTGTVDSARVSENDIVMDAEMLQILHNDNLWVGEWIRLDTTGAQAVRMTGNDSLTITGYIEVDYNFSDDLFED